MGNQVAKGISVNAKTLIVILIFVNVGFAVKMLNKYYKMKEAGYVREKTFREQLENRVMKAFGSMEELNKMINDITLQKEEAEKIAVSLKGQDEQLRLVNKKLEEAKAKLEERIRHLERDLKTPRSIDPDDDAVEAKNRDILYGLYQVEKQNLARMEAELRNIS